MDNQKSMEKTDVQILMLGLDEAGKTTLLYTLKLNDEVNTIPTIGYNVETVDFEDKSFTFWDIGGRENVRVLWRFYTENKAIVIFVVDASNSERFKDAKEFLHTIMANEDLNNAALLVVSNKHDRPNCPNDLDLAEQLDLQSLTQTSRIVNTCALDRERLPEILKHLREM